MNSLKYTDAYELCASVIEENTLSYPLDPFSLVESYGLKIITYSELCYKYDVDFQEIVDNCSSFGFLLRDIKSDRAIIYYNDHQSHETNSFTLLHELGHFLMNHQEDTEDNDKLVNCFARNLIAPANACEDLHFNDVDEISHYFGISSSAAKTRIDFLECDKYHMSQIAKHLSIECKVLVYI